MFKFLKKFLGFGKKEEAVTPQVVEVEASPVVAYEPVAQPIVETPVKTVAPVQKTEEPVKVIEDRLAEVAEKKVTAKEIKGKVKKNPVPTENPSEEAPVAKKPRRKRKPKAKTDKPADGEQK